MFIAHGTAPGVLWKESRGCPPEAVRTGACGTEKKTEESGFVQAQK